jgi:hypothetical protein
MIACLLQTQFACWPDCRHAVRYSERPALATFLDPSDSSKELGGQLVGIMPPMRCHFGSLLAGEGRPPVMWESRMTFAEKVRKVRNRFRPVQQAHQFPYRTISHGSALDTLTHASDIKSRLLYASVVPHPMYFHANRLGACLRDSVWLVVGGDRTPVVMYVRLLLRHIRMYAYAT